MTRILHAVGGLANSSGTTHIILNLSRQYLQQGHEVSIYYLTNRGYDTLLPDEPRIRTAGLPIDWKQNWGYSRAFRQELQRTIREFDVIHVHSLWLYLNWAVRRIAQSAGVPYVVAPQGTLDDWTLRHHGLKKQIYASLIERDILNRAAAIHAVSPREADNVRQFGVRSPVVVVPNGLNTHPHMDQAARERFRAKYNIPTDRLIVLYLGRLDPKKGIDLLLNAAGNVAKELPSFHAIVAGSDLGSGYRARLEAIAQQTGRADRTAFVGELKGADKHDAFSAADLFALTSHSEGQPIAVLEALGYGLPVLITTGCNLADVQSTGAGIVVPDAIPDIGAALRRMIGDTKLRSDCATRARELAETKFAWPVIARQMLQMYDNILHHRTPSEGLVSA